MYGINYQQSVYMLVVLIQGSILSKFSGNPDGLLR